MKLVNRSKTKRAIKWHDESINHEEVKRTVLRFKELLDKKGTDGLNIINKELGLPQLKKFKVSSVEMGKSNNLVSDELKKALMVAASNIKVFHEEQKKSLISPPLEITKGNFLWREFRPIDSVGLYVPGGTAPLVSSLLMQLIPATLAGCKNIIICSPPDKFGKIAPEILWLAHQYGVNSIYKVGGAQAILAMASGSTIIPRVNKIFGPGNIYVNEAKKLISNEVSIDLPAGPSEVLILTNDISKADLVAADMLSQLEHGFDSRAYVISSKLNVLNKVRDEFNKQIKTLPRQQILEKSSKNTVLIKSKSFIDSVTLINDCAPEHLILLDDDYPSFLSKVVNAGSVFCGKFSPCSFGDYASGSNHILPTNGKAKSCSGLGLIDFGKQITVQTSDKDGFKALAPTVKTLAETETLLAHSRAVSIREKYLNESSCQRSVSQIRKTNETQVFINLNLDGSGKHNIRTGINYLDHLLEQFSTHGKFDLSLSCLGDLHIDEHHSIEDIAITLGEAINKALKDRVGIKRFSHNETLVMDEVKSSVTLDLSTRRILKFHCSPLREKIGDFPSEMFKHFFVSLINSASMTCHIVTLGENSHHLLEATFKAFGRALKEAVKIESSISTSTKGIL